MAQITEDKDFYYVELEDDKWVYATVKVRKPCPLRTLLQVAEASLTPSVVFQYLRQRVGPLEPAHKITPLQRTQRVILAEEQLKRLYQVLLGILESSSRQQGRSSSSSDPSSE